VDAAVVWGPLAGFFAQRHRNMLDITPTPESDPPVPLAFSISMGVRKRDTALRDRLNEVLHRRKPEIERILRSYGVPLMEPTARGD
jgi:mxaJ protein